MGREIKRVPLDFNWPMSKPWGGFINPFYRQCIECPQCGGNGSSPEAEHLKDQWYGNAPFRPEDRGSRPWTPEDEPVRLFAERNCKHSPGFYGEDDEAILREAKRLCAHWNKAWSHHLNADDVAALLKSERLHDLTQVWTKAEGWKQKDPPHIPTPHEVNEWSLLGFGHDGINQWCCVRAECERLGYPVNCSRCNGEGSLWPTPEIKQQSEDWKQTEPPAGDGYQLWETVSEGSPISPVFADPEELAEWLASSPDYSWRKNDEGITKEKWLKFIRGPGWAPSLIGIGNKLMNGVEATGL